MYVGIDLGTSNCVATIYNGKTIDFIKTLDGLNSFPSAVFFVNENEYIIGDNAQRMIYKDPSKGTCYFKLNIGKEKYIDIKLENSQKKIALQQIMAVILKNIFDSYKGEIEKIVLTIPAKYNQVKKLIYDDVKNIINKEIAIIDEPSAAILFHIYDGFRDGYINMDDFKKGKNILVFDFGGGTLDLSLVNINYDKNGDIQPQVLLTDGEEGLGGFYVDLLVAQYIIDDISFRNSKFNYLREKFESYLMFYRNNGFFKIDINEDEEIKKITYNLIKTAEDVKKKLSTTRKDVEFEFLGHKLIFEFELFIEEIVENEIIPRIKNVIQTLNRKNKNNVCVDEILLVGGSSLLLNMNDKFKSKIFGDISVNYIKEVQYAVSKGAAIRAAQNAKINIEPFGTNVLKSVISRKVYAKHQQKKVIIFDENDVYPLENQKEVVFEVDFALSPYIDIEIIESDDEKETEIKTYKFYHPCFYVGDEIILNASINEEGIYKFSAIHKQTMESIEFEVYSEFLYTDKEKDEAKKHIMTSKTYN